LRSRPYRIGDSEYLLALAVRNDGEIALAGCTTGTGMAVVALYTANGLRDTSFGGDDMSTFQAGGFTCIRDAAFNGQRLIVGGHAANVLNSSFALGVYVLERAADGGSSRTLAFVTAGGASASSAESASSAMLSVSMSQTAAQTMTVQYTATGGTATAGQDYTLAAGPLTFAPGQTSQRIAVPLTDDAADEPDETVVIALSNPSNASLGSNPSLTLTITDNDVPGQLPYRLALPLIRR
jgi:hypothetical protein